MMKKIIFAFVAIVLWGSVHEAWARPIPPRTAPKKMSSTTQTTLESNQDQVTTPPPKYTKKKGEAPSPAEKTEAEIFAVEQGEKSPVPFRESVDDRQDPAPRPYNYMMDPNYRGFIPIPRTVFALKFNPKPRVDMMLDSENTGNDFRFVTAHFPLEGQAAHGGGARFNGNGNGSQLRLDIRAPLEEKGNFRFYYQNDFFGSDTAHFRYRLQHIYGQYFGFVGGFTYGVFEDPDMWPDTLDYEGPNAVIFARRPLIHYKWAINELWNMTFGVEDPDFYLDNSGNPNAVSQPRMPDVGFNIRWEPKDVGHMQFSAIGRAVGAEGGVLPDDTDPAWGVNLGGGFNITENDSLMFLGVFGYGVGGMGNDTSFVNSDAAYDSEGNLMALRYYSAFFSFMHKWTPRLRSTGTYGYANLENTFFQPGSAYHETHYASMNLVFQLLKRLSIGAEGLYGYKQVKDGRENGLFRGQVTMVYSLFD